MEIKINGNTIVYNSDNEIILKSGATLKAAQKSLARNAKLTALRTSATTTDASGNLVTTCDLTFKNKSSIATFIEGNSRSGTEYFKKYLSATTTTETTSSNEEETKETTEEVIIEDKKEDKKSVIEDKKARQELAINFITFCKDFEYKPDPRLLNSLKYEKDPEQFMLNSMELIGMDSDLIMKAKEKFRSLEWKNLLKQLKELKPTHDRVNKRFEIFYGQAGTGKSTRAEHENPKAKIIVASASQDPDELFTCFNPETRKWELTDFSKAMEGDGIHGESIVVNEFNFYCSESHKRFQGVLDNTKEFIDHGITIHIRDGFKIVATMNLVTNQGEVTLPDPLVSRASRIENFDKLQDLSWVW